MMALITVDVRIIVGDRGEAVFNAYPGAPETRTDANSLVRHPRTGVDNDLVILIYRCMATDIKDRPSLQELQEALTAAVVNKTAAYYGKPEEEDEAIMSFWKDLLLNADSDSDGLSDSVPSSLLNDFTNVV